MIATVPYKGQHVAVEFDEEDLPLFLAHRWRILNMKASKGVRYLQTTITEHGRARSVLFHRAVLGITDPKVHVDHINDEGLDNRRANLRTCTPSQNLANKRVLRVSKCGYRGVQKNSRGRSYNARIKVNNKLLHIGSYETPEEAAKAYDARAIEVFGAFARTNFPQEVTHAD
jgi:hypothetical protein